MAVGGDMNLKLVIKAQDEASKAIVGLQKSIEGLKKTSDKATSGMEKSFGSSLPNAIMSLGKLVGGAYLGGKLLEGAKGALVLAGNLEQAEVAFTTMLGSGEAATTLLRDLSTFAARTPFELTGIRQTAKQLLAMGIAADELIPTLKSLGDVSAGLSVPIEQVAYAYGQVRAANQLYGTELRQFMNAGVPLLAEFASMFGVTEAAARKMVEEGKIGFEDVRQAFENMSGEGGKFFNLMDKQSGTFLGKMSNLKDAVAQLGEKFGKPLLDPAKDTIQKIIDQLNGVSQSQIEFVGAVTKGIFKSLEGIASFIAKSIGLITTSISGYTQLFSVAMGSISAKNTETITAVSGEWKDVFLYLTLGLQAVIGAFNIMFQAAVDIVGGIIDINAQAAKVIYFAFADMGKAIEGIFGSLGSVIAHGVAVAVQKALHFMSPVLGVLGQVGIEVGKAFAIPEVSGIGSAEGAFSRTAAAAKEFGSSIKGTFADTRTVMDSVADGIEETRLGFVGANMPNYLKETNSGLNSMTKAAEGAAKGMEELAGGTGKAVDEAKELEKYYEEVAKNVNQFADEEIKKTEEIVDAIDGHIEKIEELKQEYTDLGKEAKKAIEDINGQISGTRDDTDKDLANRFVEINNELAKAQQEKAQHRVVGNLSGEELEALNAKIKALEEERAFAIENTTSAAREAALAWDQMSESQRILEDSNKAVQALEVKRDALVQEYQMKLDNLQQQAIAEQAALDEQVERYKTQVDTIRYIWKNHFGQLEANARGSALNLVQQYEVIAEKIRELSSLQSESGISVSQFAQSGGGTVAVSVTFNVTPGAVSSISEEDIARMKAIVNDAIVEGKTQASLGAV